MHSSATTPRKALGDVIGVPTKVIGAERLWCREMVVTDNPLGEDMFPAFLETWNLHTTVELVSDRTYLSMCFKDPALQICKYLPWCSMVGAFTEGCAKPCWSWGSSVGHKLHRGLSEGPWVSI